MVEINEDHLKEFIELVLDDEWGIRDDAYASLHRLLPENFTEKYKELFNLVDGCDNRVYLPENWKKQC